MIDIRIECQEEYQELIFKTVINKSIKFSESPTFHQSIEEYDPKGKPAQQFKEFVKEFKQRIKVFENKNIKKEAA